MLRNYLTIALRSLRRRPGYAGLNLVGLGVGMACCLLIGLYVQNELSYDRFHPEHERIVRLAQQSDDGGLAWIGDAALPILQNEIPQVETVVRLDRRTEQVAYEDGGTVKRFEEQRFFAADSTFFEVFGGFRLQSGDPQTALRRPGTVVLTPETARRYFGEEDPIGKTLRLEDQGQQEGATPLTVTGVLEPVPANSHVQFDLVSNYRTFIAGSIGSYWVPRAWTYALLKPGADRKAAQELVRDVIAAERRPEVAARFTPVLQPITDIHLHSNLGGEPAGQGSILQVTIFAAIALFILLIAAVNFINLATARATERSTEVGVRKAVGAQKTQLIRQFLGESVLLSVGGVLIALALTQAALPVFAAILDMEFAVGIWTNGVLWGIVAAVVLVTGGGAGSYPAFVLSRFQPATALKDTLRGGGRRGGWLRKGLVVFQFAISVALIVATVVGYSQLEYLRTARLGFDKDQIVLLSPEGNVGTLKQELASLPAVEHVTLTSTPPGLSAGNSYRYEVSGRRPDDSEERLNIHWVDFEFFETLGVETVSGRTPQADRRSDIGIAKPAGGNHYSAYYRDRAFVVNRAMLDKFDWSSQEAIGKELRLYILENETIYGDFAGEVIGVVENYHAASLREEIPPIVYTPTQVPTPDGDLAGYYATRSLLVRVASGNADQVMESLGRTWREVLPDEPFEATFLDDRLQAQYQNEARLSQIVGIFSGLAIFVACLGLFGLATYTARQRTKEIGIRKAVGASVASIVGLLSKDFLKLVAVAIVVGLPAAYFAVQRWLTDFAFRIDLGPTPFVLAAAAAFAVAGLTVSYHAVRAARLNPSRTLRSE